MAMVVTSFGRILTVKEKNSVRSRASETVLMMYSFAVVKVKIYPASRFTWDLRAFHRASRCSYVETDRQEGLQVHGSCNRRSPEKPMFPEVGPMFICVRPPT